MLRQSCFLLLINKISHLCVLCFRLWLWLQRPQMRTWRLRMRRSIEIIRSLAGLAQIVHFAVLLSINSLQLILSVKVLRLGCLNRVAGAARGWSLGGVFDVGSRDWLVLNSFALLDFNVHGRHRLVARVVVGLPDFLHALVLWEVKLFVRCVVDYLLGGVYMGVGVSSVVVHVWDVAGDAVGVVGLGTDVRLARTWLLLIF